MAYNILKPDHQYILQSIKRVEDADQLLNSVFALKAEEKKQLSKVKDMLNESGKILSSLEFQIENRMKAIQG
jgi:hypothetical protein